MTVLEWTLMFLLVFFYFWLVITVAVVTFRKGHWILGIFGIFLPFLWLIGALLPPMPGSSYARDQERVQYQ